MEGTFNSWIGQEFDSSDIAEVSLDLVEEMQSESEIDDLSNLEDMSVYIMSFTEDGIADPSLQ